MEYIQIKKSYRNLVMNSFGLETEDEFQDMMKDKKKRADLSFGVWRTKSKLYISNQKWCLLLLEIRKLENM